MYSAMRPAIFFLCALSLDPAIAQDLSSGKVCATAWSSLSDPDAAAVAWAHAADVLGSAVRGLQNELHEHDFIAACLDSFEVDELPPAGAAPPPRN